MASVSGGQASAAPVADVWPTLGVPFLLRNPRDLGPLARHLRRQVLLTIAAANSGHPGGSLSAVEIMTALYFCLMRHDPRNPHWPDRDRFVLSKGHCTPILYSVLAECGYFPREELATFRRINSRLQGHAHIMAPGVDASTGSLGQGLSFGVGAALAGRLERKNYRVYVLLGDGECDEGQVWEAAMSAAHYRLDNLIAIVDRNRIQNDRFTDEVMELEPLADKWRAFRWNTLEVDGHNIEQVLGALKAAPQEKGRPTVIIAHTVKGKGVSFMENNPDFHGRAPTPTELERALKELEGVG
ncbi:MAG: transketolase [Dehalococcoidia bacterium]|nr:transketolase [Dehalococcoidia bacterium]